MTICICIFNFTENCLLRINTGSRCFFPIVRFAPSPRPAHTRNDVAYCLSRLVFRSNRMQLALMCCLYMREQLVIKERRVIFPWAPGFYGKCKCNQVDANLSNWTLCFRRSKSGIFCGLYSSATCMYGSMPQTYTYNSIYKERSHWFFRPSIVYRINIIVWKIEIHIFMLLFILMITLLS